MPAISGKRGVDHALDLGPFGKPTRKLEPRLLMALEPDAEAAQAAQAEIDVLGAGAEPKLVMGLIDGGERLFGRGDDAEHGIGVANDEFGRGLDRHIDAMAERLEEQRR